MLKRIGERSTEGILGIGVCRLFDGFAELGEAFEGRLNFAILAVGNGGSIGVN